MFSSQGVLRTKRFQQTFPHQGQHGQAESIVKNQKHLENSEFDCKINMDLFGKAVAILNSIVSKSYNGMFRGQILL